jgi:hypothetical protein
MVRVRRRRTFRRERDCDSEQLTKDQETGSAIKANVPTKLGRNNPIPRSLRRFNILRGARSP